MIVSTKQELGIRLSEEKFIYEGMFDGQLKALEKKREHITDAEYEFGVNNARTMLLDHTEFPNTNFLIRETAQEMIMKIPLNEKFDVKFLRRIKNKKATFLFGKYFTVRYYKEGDNIYCFFLFISDSNDGDMLNCLFSRIDLVTGEITFPTNSGDCRFNLDNIPMKKLGENPVAQLKMFIQTLLFVELSDIEINILPPNRKIGTRKNNVFNRSHSDITVVDSKWNTISVRTDSFLVSGHWRMQPCGFEMKERKLIWIDTFEKNGYVRNRSKINQV